MHPVVPKTSESIRLDVPGLRGRVRVRHHARGDQPDLERHDGALAEHLRIILSHAGGTTPYLAGRIRLLGALPQMRERAPKGAAHYLARFYYDTALSAVPNALRSLQELVGPSRSCSAATSRSRPSRSTQASIDGLASYPGFDPAARAKIERANALALLPSVAARVGAAR